MTVVSKRINIVVAAFVALIISIILVGCGNILDTERPPLVFRGHGVHRWGSDSKWSRDFGPEQSGHFRSLAIGDFNNDGKTDIVGGSYEPGAIFLWHGDDAGNWHQCKQI